MNRTATTEADQIATARALMTRPQVQTLRLSTGFYTLIELVGDDRQAVVDTLLPQGPDGVRLDTCHASYITTYAVYEQPEQTRTMDRQGNGLIGYVMRFRAAGGHWWAEYVSDEQDAICHADHTTTLTRAVAAIARQRANERYLANILAAAQCFYY